MKNKINNLLAQRFVVFYFIWVAVLPCAFSQINTSDYVKASVYTAVADSLVKIGERDAALSFLLHSKDSLEKQSAQKSGDYLSVVRALGFFYYDHRQRMTTARQYLEEAARLLSQYEPGNKADLAFVWHIIGKSYYFNGKPKLAYPYFENSLPLWIDTFGENNENTARCYNALALCYNESGNYEKSIDYGLKAIRSLKKSPSGENHPDLGAYIYNVGYIYFSKGDLTGALKFLEEALEITQTKLGDHYDTALCLTLLGNTNASLGNGTKAIEYQLLALEMFKKVLGPEDGYIYACYKAIGRAYNINRQYPQALDYYKKALYFGVSKDKPRPPRPDVFYGMANIYRKMQNYDEARLYVDTALSQLNYAPAFRIDSLADRMLTYRSLLLKAAIVVEKYSKGEQVISRLKTAGDLLSDAKTIILARIGSFYQEKNKLAFYQLAVEGNTQAIDVYTRLYAATHNPDWVRRAFELSEINKSLLLYQMVLENKMRRKFTVPDSLVAKEEILQKNIAETENTLFSLSQKSPSAAASDSIQEQLFTFRNQYETLRRKIEIVCPDYFTAASSFPQESIESIQTDLLDLNTGLLEYFVGDSTLCVFLLLRDTFFFHQTRIDSSLPEQVTQMRQGIYDYFTAPEKTSEIYLKSAKSYIESATALYQKLVAPLKDQLPAKLIIVPEGVLGYLPFEALLTAQPERPDRFQRHLYLVREHDISYCFSAALLREMETLPSAATSGNLLAMAPFYMDAGIWSGSSAEGNDPLRSALRPLPHSGEEAYKIAGIMNGNAIVGREAKKAGFVRLAPGFRILHLATHGRANDRAGEFSFLAFPAQTDGLEAEQLTAGEIYTLKLNADLVTLSACETGLGQLYRGEGIVSLSRAFASAGTKSIVHSLWTVNDAATKTLMEHFYRNLRRGLPKDAALRQAKLSYLEQARGEAAHPFFWAGFVLLGDPSPLQF